MAWRVKQIVRRTVCSSQGASNCVRCPGRTLRGCLTSIGDHYLFIQKIYLLCRCNSMAWRVKQIVRWTVCSSQGASNCVRCPGRTLRGCLTSIGDHYLFIQKIYLLCRCNSMVEFWLPKPATRVRFPSPAPNKKKTGIYCLDFQPFSLYRFFHLYFFIPTRFTGFTICKNTTFLQFLFHKIRFFRGHQEHFA